MTLCSIFHNGSKISIGEGSYISFWEDQWGSDASLKVQFPRLFNLVVNKNASLKEMLSISLDEKSWRRVSRRNLFSWEEVEVSRLLNTLTNAPPLNQNREDIFLWIYDPY